MTAHGELWLAKLDKIRPVIILTRDPVAEFLNALIVAPVTSTVRGLDVEVVVGPADGLNRPSVANLDQLRRVERHDFIRRVGRVRPSTMSAICDTVHLAIGC